jgi:hypothetical protein
MTHKKQNIYFAITPTKRGGITDQLFQFSSFYAIGKALGYEYYHVPFSCPRSTSSLNESNCKCSSSRKHATEEDSDIYDFLGLNELLLTRNPSLRDSTFTKVDIPLGDRELRARGSVSIETLKEYIRAVAEGAQISAPILLNFELSGGGRNFLTLIQNTLSEFTIANELLSAYNATRKRSPLPNVFPHDALRIVVHARLGDTAELRTPWNTFVPLWPPDKIREYKAPPRQNIVRLADYWRFLYGLANKVKHHTYSIALFSDGYRRSIETLKNSYAKLDLADWQLRLLEASQSVYDSFEFSMFQAIPNCSLFVGEDADKLRQLINCCLSADVIVIGPQQRLVPKLLQVYLPSDKMPLVAVLLAGNRKTGPMIASHSALGLGRCSEDFFYLNINDGNALRKLGEAISSRSHRRNAEPRRELSFSNALHLI